jgi:hypothetical protein
MHNVDTVNISARIPYAFYRVLWASCDAWCFAAFRFAGLAGVLDFFPMRLRYGSHRFIVQVNEHRRHLQRFLRANSHAFCASVAFSCVYNDVEFA